MRNLAIIVILAVLWLPRGWADEGADLQKAEEAYAEKDYETAVTIYHALAERGNLQAQVILGTLYLTGGLGVLQDYQQAEKWTRRAAQQGNPGSQASLALLYYQGWGVARDITAAHMWFNIAAGNGQEIAPLMRQALEKNMSGEELARAQRLAVECVTKHYRQC